jgi:hypothetical protein
MNADSRPGLIATRPRSVCNAFTIVLVALTAQATFAAPMLAFLLAGAGHGWCTPIQVCWIALVTGPLGIVAWIFHRKWWGQVVAVGDLAVMLRADYLLREGTKAESEYFANVWDRGAQVVVTWFAVWLFLHAAVIATPVWGTVRALWQSRTGRPSCESDEAYRPAE